MATDSALTNQERLLEALDQLSPQRQEQLLAFAEQLIKEEKPQGALSGRELLDFFDRYPLSEEEAAELRRIYKEIDEGNL